MKNKAMVIMVMFAVMGFATFVFAGNGMGPGGKGPRFPECQALKNLSAEDQAKVKAEQDAFRNDTQTLRDQIAQKHEELKTEMTKTDTDEQKAAAIQKEISDLMAQMGQKRLQHLLNMKKINPALGTCGGFGGPGMGPGMGRGCGTNPNCPRNNTTTSTQDKSL